MIAINIFIVLLIIITAIFSVVRNMIKNFSDSEEEFFDSKREKEKWMKTFSFIRRITYISYAGILVVVILLSSVFFTNEQQIGFTSMFGNVSMIEGPGIHFKVPFISEKHIYDSTTKGIAIGYVEESDEPQEEDSLMITSDFNFINIDFYIEYRITEPIEYCYGSNDPEGILKNMAQSAIRNTVGQFDVDSAITTGKTEIESQVYDDIEKELEEHKIGITVINATIQDSEPPTDEVAKAFKDVENAKQGAETAINKAHEYEKEQLPAAEAKAKEIKAAATASKTERVNKAKEEVAKFEALFAEYKNNPATVKNRLYYETLQEILPNMEIIIGKDAKVIYVKDSTATDKKTSEKDKK